MRNDPYVTATEALTAHNALLGRCVHILRERHCGAPTPRGYEFSRAIGVAADRNGDAALCETTVRKESVGKMTGMTLHVEELRAALAYMDGGAGG